MKDVAGHELTILKDDGIYRHLHLGRAGSSTFAYDIVTYPGYLVISGDMGANVFSRVKDMFKFFREDIIDGKIRINEGYWREKVQNGKDGIYEFTDESFERRVRSHLEDIKDDVEERSGDFDVLMEEVESELFNTGNSELELRTALEEFEWHDEKLFNDTWEWDFNEFTFHFTWQCYAIVWAIAQYDAIKSLEQFVATAE